MKVSQKNSRTQELLTAGVISIAMIGLIVAVQLLSRLDTPEVEIAAEPDPITVFPDFASIPNVGIKKQQFFDFLQDYIVAENAEIIQEVSGLGH